VRDIVAADLDALIALNNAHAAEIGTSTPDAFAKLLQRAVVAKAIGPIGDPDAFVICFDHTTPAQGPNHSWFLARYPKFLYVDRVCVAEKARRRGLARKLYELVFELSELVVCEVNFDPPNPVSDAFHEALGFVEVGRAHLPDRGKSVRYLSWRRK
jgi:predicted GNAT superfamily acetyltransferase